MTQTAITKRLRDWGKAVKTYRLQIFPCSSPWHRASLPASRCTPSTAAPKKEIREQIDSRLLAETTSLRRRFEERTSIGLYTPVLGIIERVPGDPNIHLLRYRQTAGERQRQQWTALYQSPQRANCRAGKQRR